MAPTRSKMFWPSKISTGLLLFRDAFFKPDADFKILPLLFLKCSSLFFSFILLLPLRWLGLGLAYLHTVCFSLGTRFSVADLFFGGGGGGGRGEGRRGGRGEEGCFCFCFVFEITGHTKIFPHFCDLVIKLKKGLSLFCQKPKHSC